MLDIKNLRKEYRLKKLDVEDLNANPIVQFEAWFNEAHKAELIEANAMILATASASAKPSSRTVLLKGIDAKGLLFFTNYESRKAKELRENPFASVTFLWKELERQVIVEGRVEQISREESAAYFATRSRGSQLSVWTSHQGEVIPSRAVLEEAYAHVAKENEGKAVPLPPYWGGFRLLPSYFEFWQGRENRLHDRFRYELEGDVWDLKRLAP